MIFKKYFEKEKIMLPFKNILKNNMNQITFGFIIGNTIQTSEEERKKRGE